MLGHVCVFKWGVYPGLSGRHARHKELLDFDNQSTRNCDSESMHTRAVLNGAIDSVRPQDLHDTWTPVEEYIQIQLTPFGDERLYNVTHAPLYLSNLKHRRVKLFALWKKNGMTSNYGIWLVALPITQVLQESVSCYTSFMLGVAIHVC